MKKCRVLFLFLLVSACGFQPLYVEKKHNNAWYFSGDFDTSITQEMSQIKVEPIEERFGQLVRNELLDSLTPRGVPSHPKYRLYVELTDRLFSRRCATTLRQPASRFAIGWIIFCMTLRVTRNWCAATALPIPAMTLCPIRIRRRLPRKKAKKTVRRLLPMT